MAVSLKKPQKADLLKSNPPKICEYTPVHLLDEEDTIAKRPCQPPLQAQRLVTFEQTLEEKGIEISNDGDVRSNIQVTIQNIKKRYRSAFIISLSAIIVSFVLSILFIIFPLYRNDTSYDSVSNTSVSSETSIYFAPVESVPVENASVNEDYSFVSYFNVFLETFKELILHPAVLIMLGTTFLLLAIRLVKRIMRY